MPKTTKRAVTKRTARIAKAHATDLPKLEVKESSERKRAPGYKPPKRGLARYPWGIFLSVLIIALGIYTLYFYHVGPFALPPVKPKTTPVVKVSPTPLVPTATPSTTPSPCLSIVGKLTNSSPGPSGADFTKITHTYSQSPAMTIDTRRS